MTTSCPKCGKPLRPGARFCGSCGSSLPDSQPSEASAAQSTGEMCPHCNQSVRPGAKFCNNCGKAIPTLAPPVGAVPVPQPAEPVVEMQVTKEVGRKDDGPPPTAPPPPLDARPRPAGSPAAAPKTPPSARGRKRWLWIFAAIMIIGCGLAAAAAFLYIRDPIGLFRERTPTAPIAPTETATVPVEASNTPEPTFTLVPTDTIPPATEVSPTVALSLTVEISPTASIPGPPSGSRVILEDKFNQPLSVNWNTWGNPRPAIKQGPGSSWLNLVSPDPGGAGVTSRRENPIANAPGVAIEFEAQQNESYPQHAVIFDWDPMSYDRGPANQDPGAIHLEIHRSSLIFGAPKTSNGCDMELVGTVSHRFLLRIVDGIGVDLYLDGDTLPACRIANIGQETVPGRISFTGLGWIIGVKVTGP